MQQMVVAYVGLGSSLGDRLAHIQDAVERLDRDCTGVSVTAVSPVYESPHLGLAPDDTMRYPAHLNAVARLATSLDPMELLAAVQRVEAEGGRQRSVRWGPRTIDIDILLYGHAVIHTPELVIPHPALADRAFVSRPLADLEPALVLPDGRRLTGILARPDVQAQSLELHRNRLRLPSDTL